jgi:Relaxase/Mobilisation nuclease domain
MIVKGAARKDGAQLAAYLMESEDGARLLFVSDPAGDLDAAMTEWDEIGRLTRGEKPIYHMQLCPDARYTVDDAQWLRMAEIALKELGLEGHDYALAVHPGVKDNGEPDKPHAHLAVCRTDRDTLTMWDTSKNYEKHERASLRIAEEMGWEIVPGKHTKRDREQQPEFPRADTTQAEEQQAKRLGVTTEERKAEITALRQASDSAEAFKAALEHAGYVLAKGDQRGFVLVDESGEVFSLSKFVTDIKGKEYKAFMASIDREALPTVDDAKALQKQALEKAISEALERSKFLPPEAPSKVEEPTPAPPPAEPPSKFLPPEKPLIDFRRYADYPIAEQPSKFLPAPEAKTPEAPKAAEPAAPVIAPPAKPPAPQPPKAPVLPEPEIEHPEITKLKNAIRQRQAENEQKWTEYNAFLIGQKDFELKNQNANRLEDYDLAQNAAMGALIDQLNEKKKGVWGYINAVDSKMNPGAAIEKALARQKAIEALRATQKKEREDYIKLIEQSRQIELDGLREKQLAEKNLREKAYNEELDRFVSEKRAALRLRAQLEVEEKKKAQKPEKGDDDWPPPPKMGK